MHNELLVGSDGVVRVVRHGLDKLTHFCRHDASPGYDTVGYRCASAPDLVQTAILDAVNGPMRARSSKKAWSAFLDRPLPELAAVPSTVDLVDSPDEDYTAARERLRACYALLAGTSGITDMATSKVLHLKRPRLVAISDSYVRQALRIPDPDRRGCASRGLFYAGRALRVADAVRAVGRANQGVLDDLQRAMLREHPSIAISKARITDVLIWVDTAIGRHQAWTRWASERGWPSCGL